MSMHDCPMRGYTIRLMDFLRIYNSANEAEEIFKNLTDDTNGLCSGDELPEEFSAGYIPPIYLYPEGGRHDLPITDLVFDEHYVYWPPEDVLITQKKLWFQQLERIIGAEIKEAVWTELS